jgi:hypothetical protein
LIALLSDLVALVVGLVALHACLVALIMSVLALLGDVVAPVLSVVALLSHLIARRPSLPGLRRAIPTAQSRPPGMREPTGEAVPSAHRRLRRPFRITSLAPDNRYRQLAPSGFFMFVAYRRRNQDTPKFGARPRVSDLQRFDPRPAGECEHRKSEALTVECLQWLVLTEGRDLARRGERELVAGHGALPLFD